MARRSGWREGGCESHKTSTTATTTTPNVFESESTQKFDATQSSRHRGKKGHIITRRKPSGGRSTRATKFIIDIYEMGFAINVALIFVARNWESLCDSKVCGMRVRLGQSVTEKQSTGTRPGRIVMTVNVWTWPQRRQCERTH